MGKPLAFKGDQRKTEAKTLGLLEIKDEAKGEVEAVIATLGVVDHDEDVIAEGAIPADSKVQMSSYNHDIAFSFGGSPLPVGKGTVSVEGTKAIFRGKVFLDTDRGRDTFAVLKHMGADQEWSFGYRVLGQEVPDEKWRAKGARRIITKMDVFEVSPVLRGAGIATRTVSAKCDACAAKAQADGAHEGCGCGGKKGEPPVVTEPTAEEKAAAEAAETKRLADEQAAEADARAAAERKEAERKARAAEAVEEFHRVQRTLKRLRLVS